jgi:uncharacterized RDD family membrane protein YckC
MHSPHTTSDTAPTQPGQPAKKPGPLAPRWKRLLAAILDSVIPFCPFLLLLPFADTTGSIADSAQGEFFLHLSIITLLALLVTQCILVSIRGQSLGKIALNIRITTLDGRNPGFLRAILLRNGVVGLISMIPGVGFITCIIGLLMIFGPDRRCLHDHIAGTCVIQLPEKHRTPNAQSL